MDERQVLEDFVRWATKRSREIREGFPASQVRYYMDEYLSRHTETFHPRQLGQSTAEAMAGVDRITRTIREMGGSDVGS